MPGVPSGRGCDNCRKSKKKCDEAKPVCTRCARRGVECVGAGEKRYKFMEECPTTLPKKRSSKQHVKPAADRKNDLPLITFTPRNNADLLGRALLAASNPGVDIRYSLSWTYGGYLLLVPRRLGINEGLDATVDALVTTHAEFSSRKDVTITSLKKYSRALNAVRKCLDNPLKAGTSETLCAVSLLLLVQHMLGPMQQTWTGHAEGAAKILKARKNCAPRDAFETILLLALRGPVLFEGIFNPNIDLSPQEWKELVDNELDAGNPEGDMLHALSQIPDLLRRTRNNCDGLPGLLSLQAEMKGYYDKTRGVCDQFASELIAAETPGNEGAFNPYGMPPVMLHAHCQRMYGIAITLALIMNYTLVAMRTNDPSLAPDATYLALEMLSLAENAIIYRPFGACYVPLGLQAAWAAVNNQPMRALIEVWIADYQQDFNLPGVDHRQLEKTFDALDPFRLEGSSTGWPDTVEQRLYDPLQIERQVSI
ncbi:hypothetical protein BDW59DRAFT_145166 [Aspergillus cavernicola]|uniref:Zn(2)-C6 fungal-type domain-containing protein n=1 Tax=Aspergillus cavernicola TaxID=176166 RepID=A0ABR4IFA3_9EURO